MIYFELIIIVFVSVTILMIGFMIIYLAIKRNNDSKFKKWKNMADILIRNAIFLESDEEVKLIPVTHRTNTMLSNGNFRAILTQELLSAKKNISGTAAINLENLYSQLNLDKYAVKKLRSSSWHIKAKAIQELGIMGQKDHLNKIYRSTNNKNDLVRMEAQTTIVKLYGFEGLRFLDVVSYQISEWQQIKLLQELSRLAPDNFSGIEKWLSSTNLSVIVFGLKLIRNYHRFELYNQITELLNHPNDLIRLEVIYTLEKIYTNDTSKILIDRYPLETLKNQKTIIKVLQEIAYPDDIPNLIQFLNQDENELKRQIVRTIAHISPEGLTEIENLPESKQYPLDQIIKQIKGELI